MSAGKVGALGLGLICIFVVFCILISRSCGPEGDNPDSGTTDPPYYQTTPEETSGGGSTTPVSPVTPTEELPPTGGVGL